MFAFYEALVSLTLHTFTVFSPLFTIYYIPFQYLTIPFLGCHFICFVSRWNAQLTNPSSYTSHLSIHTFISPFFHSFIHSLIHSLTYSFIHTGNGVQRPLADPPGDVLAVNAMYVVTGSNGLVVREGPEQSSLELMTLHRGEHSLRNITSFLQYSFLLLFSSPDFILFYLIYLILFDIATE